MQHLFVSHSRRDLGEMVFIQHRFDRFERPAFIKVDQESLRTQRSTWIGPNVPGGCHPCDCWFAHGFSDIGFFGNARLKPVATVVGAASKHHQKYPREPYALEQMGRGCHVKSIMKIIHCFADCRVHESRSVAARLNTGMPGLESFKSATK